MYFEFYTWVVVQGLVLAALLASNRTSMKSSSRLFAPVSWLVLFYSLTFWIPQLFMPLFDFTLIGAHNVIREGQLDRVIETQRALLGFLVPLSIGYFLIARPAPRRQSLVALSRRELRVGVLLVICGFVGVGAMIAGLDPTVSRSMIVASLPGKILYAVSFWFTLGYMLIAAWLIQKRRFTLLVIVTAMFAVALLPLGGRGRILWPIAGLVAYASICGYWRIRLWKLLVSAIGLWVVLQALDPILLYYRGHDTAEQALERFSSGLDLYAFLFARNFDSIHNLAVIVGEDRVPTNPRYLLGNAQQAFMGTYFPSVAWYGFGYPATLPGGLWLSGKWITLFGGGFFYGVFIGWLSRIYAGLKSELALIPYCIAMPWLCHIGIAYLDSYLKMTALILPGVLLARFYVRRSTRVQPVLSAA